MIGRYLVAGALVAQGVVAMAGEPFQVTVVSSPAHVPLGIPANLMVQAENVSGAPVPVAFNRPPLSVQVKSDFGTETYCPFCTGRWGVVRRLLPGNWRYVENVVVPLKAVGRYSLLAVLKHHWNINKKPAEYPHLWWGRSLSQAVKVEIVAPKGIDKQAYEEFGPGVVFDGRRYGELLRRFPTSTYAAYVVWKRTWPGLRSDTADVPLYAMKRGLSSFPPTSLPCVDPQSAACKDVGFPPSGLEGARRQAAWLNLAFRAHPTIWFADELRYKIAVSAFFLGDTASCAAGLEALAAHGRPYVAAKAKDLLAAMRAKGMLPGEGK